MDPNQLTKESGMRKIIERAKSIGAKKKEKVAITPMFDNAIEALKSKIEKRHYMEKIIDDKRKATETNELKRNKVVEMEQKIKEHLKVVFERRAAQIRSQQVAIFNSVQQKLVQRKKRLRELESAEDEMIRKLEHTRIIHSHELSVIQPYVNAFELKSSFDKTPNGEKETRPDFFEDEAAKPIVGRKLNKKRIFNSFIH